jgi:hypothetical protein
MRNGMTEDNYLACQDHIDQEDSIGELTDTDKLYVDILKKDVEAYRKLETWGSSLFIAAIGVLAKQLVEWALPAGTATPVTVHPIAYALPAVVGLVAFTFLRIVNYRLYHARGCLLLLAGQWSRAAAQPGSFDFLGWVLALMPLGLGYMASWYLVSDIKVRSNDAVSVASYLGGLALFVALALHTAFRKRCREA